MTAETIQKSLIEKIEQQNNNYLFINTEAFIRVFELTLLSESLLANNAIVRSIALLNDSCALSYEPLTKILPNEGEADDEATIDLSASKKISTITTCG